MPVPFFTGSRQLNIELAEPVVILRGQSSDNTTAILRGELELVLDKPMSASSILVKLVGKSHTLWPDGLGGRSTKLYHEKTIHEQNIILQTLPDENTMLPAGLHRWPFEFLLSSRLVETIEDDFAKVYYYVTGAVNRTGMGNANLKARRNILLLRAMTWSDQALTSHSLANPSILVERRLPQCDATIFIEKSMASSGTHFPISLTLSAHRKHVHLESLSVMLQERRIYQLPEFDARRGEVHDFRLALVDARNQSDLTMSSFAPPLNLNLPNLKRVLAANNAHIPLSATPFQYQFVFNLPNCVHLNHTTSFDDILFTHYLKIDIELSFPQESNLDIGAGVHVDDPNKGTLRTAFHLDTPITILDCRLKDDYGTLPSYEASVHDTAIHDLSDVNSSASHGFFMCPCYLKYKKEVKQITTTSDARMSRHNLNVIMPPPPYTSPKQVKA
ncbi:hypothetical protein DM01DRAFT_1330792 [Hesseltinella vesiculosa]|uniref:Arrestin-like N-terminal domain-containing protein n=1 Tax=Hesseltinella vesiculosa TaxID=101127 RepID=A0A1X2GX39_9FUNG|nr:hypothetical protein DM01DRAFT_1330792 [Hesseltinella vesiculosa]